MLVHLFIHLFLVQLLLPTIPVMLPGAKAKLAKDQVLTLRELRGLAKKTDNKACIRSYVGVISAMKNYEGRK